MVLLGKRRASCDVGSDVYCANDHWSAEASELKGGLGSHYQLLREHDGQLGNRIGSLQQHRSARRT